MVGRRPGRAQQAGAAPRVVQPAGHLFVEGVGRDVVVGLCPGRQAVDVRDAG